MFNTMRNSNEISAELTTKLAELDACQDVAQRNTLAAEVEACTRELQNAQIDEAARKALANQRTLSPKEEAEMKRFSIINSSFGESYKWYDSEDSFLHMYEGEFQGKSADR